MAAQARGKGEQVPSLSFVVSIWQGDKKQENHIKPLLNV
jgi:hypothetical protein